MMDAPKINKNNSQKRKYVRAKSHKGRSMSVEAENSFPRGAGQDEK